MNGHCFKIGPLGIFFGQISSKNQNIYPEYVFQNIISKMYMVPGAIV